MTTNNAKSDFELAVEKAEQQAQSSLGLYKFKLFLFALLGYVVIFGILFTLIGLVGGLIGTAFYSTAVLIFLLKKKLIFIILPVIWILLKALWVKLEPPTGYVLKPADYPTLFAEIDALCKQLDAPKVHEVILTSELNAAINQTPRLGIFGWYKNTLIFGLELLLVLSPEQAKAVLAHELGHLSGNHSRFNGWIYRVRLIWDRIMDAFHHVDNFGAAMMRRFFDWYAPQFSAYSFALARINEYEADAVSAELTNTSCAGDALINVHVAGPYVDNHYWSEFFKKADELPEPHHAPWIGLSGFLREHKPAPGQLNERLDDELEIQTQYYDTHPALTDRLRALNVKPQVPLPSRVTAAQAWLGPQFENVIQDFDKEWLEYNKLRWKERFDYVVESKQFLAKVADIGIDSLSDEDMWKKGLLTDEFESEDAALPIFQAYQQRHPADADAAFVIGRMLYDKEGDELLMQMKTATESPGLVIDACRYAYHYLMKSDRESEAEWWRDRANEKARQDYESQQEREELSPKDSIVEFKPNDEMLDDIIRALKTSKKVKKAWIAQKQVKYYPEVPAVTIAFIPKGMSLTVEKLIEQVTERLDLDCSFFVVPKAGDYKKLAKKIIKNGTQIL